MSGDTSRAASRENSTGDLLSSASRDKRKNVHFNQSKDDSALEVRVASYSNSPSEYEMDNIDLASPIAKPASVRRKPRSQSNANEDRPASSLFFLAEDDDDATNTPITPFKKTGKIRNGMKVASSPAVRPHSPAPTQSGSVTPNPFSLEPETPASARLADRRNISFDIPMIRLPSSAIDDTSFDSFPNRTPGGTPGTPSEGAVDPFSNTSRSSIQSFDSSDQLANALLTDNTLRNATGSTGVEDIVPAEVTEEHRKMNLAAYKLVRAHTVVGEKLKSTPKPLSTEGSRRNSFVSTVGSETEVGYNDQLEALDSDILNKKCGSRGGVLSNLMQLYSSTVYQQPQVASRSHGGSASGTSTPKWHQRNSQSNASLTALLGAGQAMAGVGGLGAHSRSNSAVSLADLDKSQRPNLSKMRKHSGNVLGAVRQSFHRGRTDELRITLAIADVLQRQKFIIKLCKALMIYGAPTHRLEDYLKLTARALEIDAQFLYIPGCMIVAFDDKTTHTTDVKIVRVVQGVDLGKLNAVHTIYKNVLHSVIEVDQGIVELDQQLEMPQLYKVVFVLIVYGLAAVCVGPFAFESSWIDLPIQFLLGLIVGALQLIVAPRSSLYANVFEIVATIAVSFLGRAFGSIPNKSGDGTVFCFAALAQSAIALILPGYMVLCGALELQSKSIVAGSVRLFYAIVYSLFLSFGITIGAILYGWMDSSATNATSCTSDISGWYRFLFVPGFTLCLLIVNQAKPRQVPIALFIAGAGYATNYFSNKKFGSSEVSNAIAAFVIGCLGNLYSRLGHGLAFTAVLPSIFVQVPSGLASSSSLISGLELANSVLNNTANSTSSSSTLTSSGSGALDFSYNMITIAIGLTVGLFLSALVIYIPICGTRKRTGMMTF